MMTTLKQPYRIEGAARSVSQLALGTAFYQLQSKETWFELLDLFVEHGGTLIDSGRIYGQSEAVIGEWLKRRGRHDDLVLITKGGHGPGKLPEDFEKVVAEEIELSLTTLGINCVDCYMLHRDNPSIPVERVVEFLNRFIEAKVVRSLGVSNWEYGRIRAANEYAATRELTGIAAVSNNLSLAQPAEAFYPGLVTADREGERWHEQTQTPLVVWSAQARGFFTGRWPAAMRERMSETEGFDRRMLEVYGTDENYERLRRAEKLAGELNVTPTQVALAWLLHRPFPIIPIVGPHTREELLSCIEATQIELTDEQQRWLNLATD